MKKSIFLIKSIIHMLVAVFSALLSIYLDLVATGITLILIRGLALTFAILFTCVAAKFFMKYITLCFGIKISATCTNIKDRLPSHMDEEHTPIVEMFLTYKVGSRKITDIVKKDKITSMISSGDSIPVRKMGIIYCFDYLSFKNNIKNN